MMDVEEAKHFSEKHFPKGPEALATKLGINVVESPLTGCDGWVLSGPKGTVIRLNSLNTSNRRRFTLAHEISHLLLGIPTVVGESINDSLKSDDREERRVNNLASELLLPTSVVKTAIPSVPVVALQLRKLAKHAKVSELAAAIRVVNLAESIGLSNACVTFFQNGEFKWNWSTTLKMPPELAVSLMQDAQKDHPAPVRIVRKKTKDVVIASLIENPNHNSQTMLVQLLPEVVGNTLSPVELRTQLEQYLFDGDNEFRMQLQGVFGSFRPKCIGLSLEDGYALFFEQKGERWQGVRRSRLHSAKGREYVRLRLKEWCK